MERNASLAEARRIFGKNFIGREELGRYHNQLGIAVPPVVPEIPYDRKTLATKSAGSILALGASHMDDGRPVTILSLRERFGVDQEKSEPCFYNQDWYLKEKFASLQLQCKWNLISTSLLNDSRGKSPDTLAKTWLFPSAILCTYVFFVGWFHFGRALWGNDFVWCDDVDHNGDRIYVGRYYDLAGVNKNGFSIHRHLALKDCYGCVQLD